MLGFWVGQGLGVEAAGVEAVPPVFDHDLQVVAAKAHEDLDLGRRAAVPHGVRAGLLDAEHHIPDGVAVGAVALEVVAQASPQARQAVGLGARQSAGAAAPSAAAPGSECS